MSILSSAQDKPVVRQVANSLLGVGLTNAVDDLVKGRFDAPEYNNFDVPIFGRPAFTAQVTDSRAKATVYGTTNKERLAKLLAETARVKPENQIGEFD